MNFDGINDRCVFAVKDGLTKHYGIRWLQENNELEAAISLLERRVLALQKQIEEAEEQIKILSGKIKSEQSI